MQIETFHTRHINAHRTCPELGSRYGLPTDRLLEHICGMVSPRFRSGWTIDPRTLLAPMFGDNDYVVSLFGHEIKFRGKPDHTELGRWIRGRTEVLLLPPHMVGGWLNPRDGLTYIDISVIVEDRSRAIELGIANRQLAVYHPASDTSIRLGSKESGGVQ